MKKSLIALAVLAMAGAAFATPSWTPPTGVSSSSGTSSAGVSTTSIAGAASMGNGTAYTYTAGGQFASSQQSNSAGTSLVGTQLGGQATVKGTAETAGYAVSYTKTTGSGIAGSMTFGEACADSQAQGGFLALNGAHGTVFGEATSRGANAAGTASFGVGEALRGNETSNFSAFEAHADAGKKLFTTQNLIANTSASAQSDSTKGVLAPITSGNGVGFQNSVNFGAAVALANAAVGNCNSCTSNGGGDDEDKPKKPKGNNGWGNGGNDGSPNGKPDDGR